MKLLTFVAKIFCKVTLPALALALAFGSQAQAQEPQGLSDCSSVSLYDFDDGFEDCVLVWIENNQKFRLIVRAGDETTPIHASPALGSAEGSVTLKGPAFEISSRRPPTLIDMDQDGWTDLWFLEDFGMANASYQIFRYFPDAMEFRSIGQVNGTNFYWDKAGYFVEDIRSGCCARVLTFSTIDAQRMLTRFTMDITAPGFPREGDVAACETAALALGENDQYDGENLSDLTQTNPGMIAAYCAYYDEDPEARFENRAVDLVGIAPSHVTVPAGTVFYCQLDDGTHEVTVTLKNGLFSYGYGTIGQPADLIIERREDLVDVLPDNGAGSSRFGFIKFENEGYVYTTYYSYELLEFDDRPIETQDASAFPNSTFARALVVSEGDQTNYILDKDCLLEKSYDEISRLDRS